MRSSCSASALAAALTGALVLSGASTAGATVIAASSEAFDALVDIEVPSQSIDVMAGPVTSVGSVAPGPYGLYDSEVLGISHGGVVFDASITATFSSAASSDVDGLAGARTTDAAGGIEDVTITFSVFSTEILRIDVSQIIASASVTGEYGSLAASGATGPIDVMVDTPDWNQWSYQLTPDPNQLLLDNGVIQIIANEQIVSCSGPVGGTHVCGIEVNALHIYIDGNINGAYTFGEAIIGHAFATMTAVPEPGTALLVGVGLALVALRRRA